MPTAVANLPLIAGDTPVIDGTESDGLTGKTLTARLQQPSGTVIDFNVGNGRVIILDAVAGTFQLVFQAGDLVQGCDQKMQITITEGAVVVTTQVFFIDVGERL